MNWNPTTSAHARQQRAQLLHDVRAFFWSNKVLEVETPALSLAGNTDPYINSFQFGSDNKSQKKRYLHTSPEYPMKRLLAANSGDIYQICKVWREGEVGKNHNPEFTLLEWYRVGFSYYQLMLEVRDLLHHLIPSLNRQTKFFSYKTLFLEKLEINPHIATHDELIHCAGKNIAGLSCDGLDQQGILDALLTHCIEPDFSDDCLTFVYDYPVSQSALAQIREATPSTSTNRQEHDIKQVKSGGGVFNTRNAEAVAERFEVYLGQMELGNGYQEEVGYQRNQQILQDENKARLKAGLQKIEKDEYFLAACEAGIPRSAGVAIGIDRILMCILGVDSIQEVINFPWDKA